MQAQVPLAPYTGLWSRLQDFDPAELSRMTEDKEVVRGTLMRRTVHLVTADDFLALRPVMQDMVERGYASSPFAPQIEGVDLDELLATGRKLVEEQPRTTAELREELGPRWPDADAASLAYAVRYHLPLVQLPPRGLWPTRKGAARARVTTVDHWLGCPLSGERHPGTTIRRYLAAFGPATVQDIAAWSGLTKVREAVEQLEGLRTLETDDGRQLLDVEDGPRPPDPDRRPPPPGGEAGPPPAPEPPPPPPLPPAVRQRRARPQGPHAHRQRPRPPDPRARQADAARRRLPPRHLEARRRPHH